MRKKLRIGIILPLLVGIVMAVFCTPAFAGHYRNDFDSSLGVFRQDHGSSNGMHCEKTSVKIAKGALRLKNTKALPCARVTTKGVATFGGGDKVVFKARVKSNQRDGDGVWDADDVFRTGDPADGEYPLELVKGNRLNARAHSGDANRHRCSGDTAGKTFNVSLRKWTVLKTVIKPNKISFFAAGKRLLTETKAQHVKRGCSWPVANSAGKILPLYWVFGHRRGGFGGDIGYEGKRTFSIDWVDVKY